MRIPGTSVEEWDKGRATGSGRDRGPTGLPSLGGLDISPIFAFIALNLLDMLVIRNLAAMTGMPQLLSPFL